MGKTRKICRISFIGLFLVFIFMSSANAYKMKNFQHPDEGNKNSIFENISIEKLRVFNDVTPETYVFLFWLCATIARYVLAVIGFFMLELIYIAGKFRSFK